MTVSTIREAGNALVVDPDSDPDFAGDLSQISLDLSRRANLRTGTSAERRSLPPSEVWPGLEYYETNTDYKYQYSAQDGWRRANGRRSWTWSRYRDPSVHGSDDAKAGEFTQICALDIPDAPNGAYMIHVSGYWFTAEDATSIGTSRVTVGQYADFAPDYVQTLTPSGASFARAVTFPDWPGGYMSIRLLVNPAQATGRVWNAGTGLVAQFLGPN